MQNPLILERNGQAQEINQIKERSDQSHERKGSRNGKDRHSIPRTTIVKEVDV
jgi:hypothetical protein